MGKRAIVYTVDDNTECILQMCSSIKSVRSFEPESHDIYILTNKPRSWMYDILGSSVVDVGPMVDKYGLTETGIIWRRGPVSPMLMFRLFIPLVPELQSYDQILYLDTDTEVWSSKFFGIFDIDRNCDVICVRDTLSKRGASRRISELIKQVPGFSDEDWVYNNWERLISCSEKYANSGVLVFNMPVIRPGYERRAEYIVDKIKLFKPYYSDQDTMNIYYRKYVIDDRRYNAWNRLSPDIYLRHYVGNERRRHGEYPFLCSFRPNPQLDSVQRSSEMGTLSGIFDMVYILTDGKNDANSQRAETWMREHGVSRYKKIPVAYTGKYDHVLDEVPHDEITKEELDLWAGHYKAVVDAMTSARRKILVIDQTFDCTGLDSEFTQVGPDFDVAIFGEKGSLRWFKSFKAKDIRCYALGIKGLVDLRRLYESLWYDETEGRMLRRTHTWFTDKILHKERTFVRA